METLVAVFDQVGFVGAFAGPEDARSSLKEFIVAGVPLVYLKYPARVTTHTPEPPTTTEKTDAKETPDAGGAPGANEKTKEPSDANEKTKPKETSDTTEKTETTETSNSTDEKTVVTNGTSGSNEHLVWVLPYKGSDAPAFVSDDRQKVEAVQKTLLSVGWTYPDSVEYWEHKFGVVTEAAAQRLKNALIVLDKTKHKKLTEEDKMTVDIFLKYLATDVGEVSGPGKNVPVSGHKAESIMDYVEPQKL